MSSNGKREMMNAVRNPVFSRPFVESLFLVQNKWHSHGVLLHTLRVFYNVLKNGEFRFFAAALLHDIGKPFCAYKKDAEDIEYGEYSFTDHEEVSYMIIRNWPFISVYTKNIVRYHYLIRDIKKSREEDLKRYCEKKSIWEGLDEQMQKDIESFMRYDDLGKGKRRR